MAGFVELYKVAGLHYSTVFFRLWWAAAPYASVSSGARGLYSLAGQRLQEAVTQHYNIHSVCVSNHRWNGFLPHWSEVQSWCPVSTIRCTG